MRLLVSVRNSSEAITAATAGADLVDVKEPDAGSLGYAGIQTIREVVSAVAGRVPVSAALGECSDWLRNDAVVRPSQEIPDSTFAGLSFVKLGLANMVAPTEVSVADAQGHSRQSERDDESEWINQWKTIRDQLTQSSAGRNVEDDHLQFPQWVAVAYADHQRAGAPTVWQVLASAAASGCSTLLIDTFQKDGSGTLDWLTETELLEVRSVTLQLGLKLALAGQLDGQHLPVVRRVNPDIFAVRGAVCVGSDRRATVSGARVRQFTNAMRQG